MTWSPFLFRTCKNRTFLLKFQSVTCPYLSELQHNTDDCLKEKFPLVSSFVREAFSGFITRAKVNILQQCFFRKDLHSLGSVDIFFSIVLHSIGCGLTTWVFMDEFEVLRKVILFSWCLVVALFLGILLEDITNFFSYLLGS